MTRVSSRAMTPRVDNEMKKTSALFIYPHIISCIIRLSYQKILHFFSVINWVHGNCLLSGNMVMFWLVAFANHGLSLKPGEDIGYTWELRVSKERVGTGSTGNTLRRIAPLAEPKVNIFNLTVATIRGQQQDTPHRCMPSTYGDFSSTLRRKNYMPYWSFSSISWPRVNRIILVFLPSYFNTEVPNSLGFYSLCSMQLYFLLPDNPLIDSKSQAYIQEESATSVNGQVKIKW